MFILYITYVICVQSEAALRLARAEEAKKGHLFDFNPKEDIARSLKKKAREMDMAKQLKVRATCVYIRMLLCVSCICMVRIRIGRVIRGRYILLCVYAICVVYLYLYSHVLIAISRTCIYVYANVPKESLVTLADHAFEYYQEENLLKAEERKKKVR